jgi:hypothetical protein
LKPYDFQSAKTFCCTDCGKIVSKVAATGNVGIHEKYFRDQRPPRGQGFENFPRHLLAPILDTDYRQMNRAFPRRVHV